MPSAATKVRQWCGRTCAGCGEGQLSGQCKSRFTLITGQTLVCFGACVSRSIAVQVLLLNGECSNSRGTAFS